MPHPILSEIELARTRNLKKQYDAVYYKLDALCKKLSDMDLQSFHAIHDQLAAELDQAVYTPQDNELFDL